MRKTVAIYTSAFSANLAKGMLENEGIPAMILNENLPFITGAVNTDMLSIELVVDEKDYSSAKKLLEACSSAE